MFGGVALLPLSADGFWLSGLSKQLTSTNEPCSVFGKKTGSLID
jgi:hypothetical protein